MAGRFIQVMLACIALMLPAIALAQAPIPVTRNALVPFDNSPFPYRGIAPQDRQAVPRRRGRRAARPHTRRAAASYWEDTTYSDRRVLLSIPRGFDIRRPSADRRVLSRQRRDADPRRAQPAAGAAADRRVRTQRRAGGAAVRRRRCRFQRAAGSGSRACSRNSSTRRRASSPACTATRGRAPVFERAPVVIAAYSGGYHPLAFALRSAAPPSGCAA